MPPLATDTVPALTKTTSAVPIESIDMTPPKFTVVKFARLYSPSTSMLPPEFTTVSFATPPETTDMVPPASTVVEFAVPPEVTSITSSAPSEASVLPVMTSAAETSELP